MDTELVEMLKQTGAVKFGDFTLSSGRKSTYYVDKYIFETNPVCLSVIGDRIAKLIPAGTRRLAGIEIGSIPLAAVASVKSGMPFVVVRKATKGYGTNKLIEGVWQKGEKVFVVEDVVTTARGALGAIHTLREAGLAVDEMVCVVDREEGGRESLEQEGVKVRSLVKSSELLGYKP
ncbi:orotate phosphoribosyltransferase [Methanocella arvoryzae]|uniref:Orotate phosphoribosyltransferase n=1 Tax=Methanocella arvoryzae (strain DSM 22066 / NBRC 105507 / MRE50) TaxID=351160 RepID=PYRE_METAR|nr:orotate phosphoribosyltransferase [Methanocella arvoryzae]Q0W6Q2.1 RecName: Full=Orotate phosphoribosyltransferase; Short=OPRT; Short=OPRTase [Methanocella arvoryzae MRE50]CAJ35941.1 orotate phosphoribosyltransferase [Methanocella arvoryzae MRE50]